jgi:hypothetical protein
MILLTHTLRQFWHAKIERTRDNTIRQVYHFWPWCFSAELIGRQ